MMSIFPQVLAHRGASHYAPENTKAAIELAAKLGAEWIEVDLHLTADNNVAIIHNSTVNSCTNGRGSVIDFTAQAIAKLDAGSWFSSEFVGQKVLLLDQLIKLLTRLNLSVNLELKPIEGKADELAAATARIVKEQWPKNKALPMMSSFSPLALAAIQKYLPRAPRALLLSEWDKQAIKVADQLECGGINLSRKIVTQKIVNTIKATDRTILVYTVNSWRIAKPLFEMGVDGVFTNRPDVMLEKLKNFSVNS
jgi:glycerophosphoryl diester phosphodiesterase